MFSTNMLVDSWTFRRLCWCPATVRPPAARYGVGRLAAVSLRSSNARTLRSDRHRALRHTTHAHGAAEGPYSARRRLPRLNTEPGFPALKWISFSASGTTEQILLLPLDNGLRGQALVRTDHPRMDVSFYKELGRRVAELRYEQELTQEALAEHTEISANYIAKIEIGQARPTLDALGQVANALGVPLWRLVGNPREVSAEEQSWGRSARELARVTETLSRGDLKLLTGLARRLAKS